MSYATVIEGLIERFEGGVDGLAQYDDDGKLVNILDYEPTALHTLPTLYLLLDSFDRGQEGQVTTMRYRILARLCVAWQDNETAEEEIIPFVNTLAAAVDADAQLGKRIGRGLASVADGNGTWVNIGGTLYRSLDVYVDVLEKGGYRGGI